MTLMVLGDECCEGPTLIEAKTFRMGGHSTADDPRLYIPQEVFDEWKKKDPIPRFEKFLEASGLWTPKIGAAVLQEVTDEVAVAAREAQQVGPPALETIFSDVYAELPAHIRKQGQAAFDLARRKGDAQSGDGEFPL
jgi:TPP-dependent pyruvate/acetoin dehydrogenase alpha subunit